MQHSKSLTLMTDIYNKLRTKTFVSRTCPTHITSLPIYICQTCFENDRKVLCNQCFEVHQCSNKIKAQLSQWTSQQQQKLSKFINDVQKQCQKSIYTLQCLKIKLPNSQNNSQQSQKSPNQVNTIIMSTLSIALQQIQKAIEQNCTKPVMQGTIRNYFDIYVTDVKLQLNKLTGNNEEIVNLVSYCEKATGEVLEKIRTDVRNAKENSSKIYRESVWKVVNEIVGGLLGFDNVVKNNANSQKPTNNNSNKSPAIDQDALKVKIQSLQKQLQLSNQSKTHLEQELQKITTKFAQQSLKQEQKIKQGRQLLQNSQKQVQLALLKVKQYDQKLQKYEKMYKESVNRQVQWKKLEEKCRFYQEQLANSARTGSVHQNNDTKNDNENLIDQLNQLTNKYQKLILESSLKEKKASEVSLQLNNLKFSIEQRRLTCFKSVESQTEQRQKKQPITPQSKSIQRKEKEKYPSGTPQHKVVNQPVTPQHRVINQPTTPQHRVIHQPLTPQYQLVQQQKQTQLKQVHQLSHSGVASHNRSMQQQNQPTTPQNKQVYQSFTPLQRQLQKPKDQQQKPQQKGLYQSKSPQPLQVHQLYRKQFKSP